MKRIILMMLGLLVVSMFLIGCSQEDIEVVDEEGNLVGEASSFAGKYRVQLTKPIAKAQTCDDLNCQLECEKVVGGFAIPNFDNGQDLCTDNGFDSCTSAMIVGAYDAPDGEFQQVAFPADCDSDISTLLDRVSTHKKLIDPPSGGSFSSGESLLATCCRIG